MIHAVSAAPGASDKKKKESPEAFLLSFTAPFSDQGISLSSEALLKPGRYLGEGVVKVLRPAAACPCELGLAAALAADEAGRNVDELACLDGAGDRKSVV